MSLRNVQKVATDASGTPRHCRVVLPINTPRPGLHTPLDNRIPSPSLKTPGARSCNVAVNDDEAERRKRRLATHMHTVMSPGCHTPLTCDIERARSTDSSTMLTNAQIAEHYASCIKLSSENKISSKNAFGLHLIDYMSEMLWKKGEVTNFQVAGCTLDASAKIYAGRVDSIYNDAYKMLGGLGSGKDEAPEKENSQEKEESVNEKVVNRKKKNCSGTVTTVENTKALDSTEVEFGAMLDPLIKKARTSLDENGVEGLLLNQLSIRDCSCSIVLDHTEVYPITDSRPNPGCDIQMQDVLKHLKDFENLEICPTFSKFSFSGTCKNSLWKDRSLGMETDMYRPHCGADYSMLPMSCSEPSGSLDEDDVAETESFWDSAEPEASTDTTAMGKSGDAKVVRMLNENKENQSRSILHHGLGTNDLILSEAVVPSEYSYLDVNVFSTWAGPQHWKSQPERKEKEKVHQEVKTGQATKRKSKRQLFRLDLTAVPDPAESFAQSKGLNKLTSSSLRTMVYPKDTHIAVDTLFELLVRPKWKVQRCGVTENTNNGPLLNASCHHSFQLHGDSDDEVLQDSGMDMNTLPTSPQPAGITDHNSWNTSSATTGNILGEHHLVDQPRKVQQIELTYARTAKKLDVKRLKSHMWTEIEQAEANTKQLRLSDLCSRIPAMLPKTIAENISVPICFICLLHLANEKVLKIESEQMSDCTVQTELLYM